jgi:multiple sugar transport system permease protein
LTRQRSTLLGLAFISPWIIGFLGLTLYPVMKSLYYSFCDYDVLSQPVWVGMQNYSDMADDAVFWKSLSNTFIFAMISLPVGAVVSLLIALLLNQPVPGRNLFRTLFFVPSMVPAVAVGMIWLWLFNGKFGLLNYALGQVGISGPNWLTDEHWTKPALIITTLWQTGGSIVIYLAALQDVPRHLYESARIDGASRARQVWSITLPIISPVIYFNVIIGIIGSLQVFAGPYVMLGQGGGPNRSALFYAVYLYQNAFQYNQMGYASAMAWVLFGIILVTTVLATRVARRLVYQEAN